MLIDCGNQTMANPAKSQPDGSTTQDRNQKNTGSLPKAELALDRVGQGGQQCKRNAIIEKTLAFQERSEPRANPELAERRQHSDRISRGDYCPEEQRYGPR